VSFVRALLNQVRATVLAMRAIRSVNPAARLIQTDDLGFTRSRPALAEQAAFDNERRWLAFDLLCGRVDDRHPLWDWLRACGTLHSELEELRSAPCPPDIIGINAYVTSERFLDDRIELHPPHLHGGNGRQIYADVETVRAHGALIDGFGARLRETHARYGLPVAITEVHMGCTREEQLRWLHQAWIAAMDAKRDGVDVRGVTAWAAFGTVDWSSLLTREAGHYEPGLWDIRTNPPRLTAVGRLAGALGRGEPLNSGAVAAVLEGAGWWQRDLRLSVAPHGDVTALPARGATLLIVGRNPLAHAFARLSHMRGLPYEWRESVDDLGIDALLDLLQSHDVWAMIHTSSEADTAVAHKGASIRTLVVHDSCSPHDVNHRDSAASTLRVHTGALFGPWSGQHDVLAAGLARLERGEPWDADDREHVWPTYIPDLVQAALDLLIDGEMGSWHLTHGESMSWCDFARRAARLAGLQESLVKPIGAFVPVPSDADPQAVWPRLLPTLDDALSRYANDHEPVPRHPPPLRASDGTCRAVRRSMAHPAF
ncbi:MAG: sugar nucleotide-binding protein, partial [Pseudomonadota bacterium]|nr:sugar nucleotide-binding protein [Pseudomonadota bacterium]